MEDMIILPERIDSSNAAEVERDILRELGEKKGEDICFDAGELKYISSAGLRIFLKVKKETGSTVTVINVSSDIYEIFDTTGFTSIVNVKKRLRSISLEGAVVIGRGFYGTVYRLDEDTIVKVYNSPDAIPMIENEKNMARKAFVKGIPTAISFDIVKVGDSYGSVFELLRSKTFNDLIIEAPEKTDEITKRYVGLMKQVHSIEADEGDFDTAKNRYLKNLDSISRYIGEELYHGIKSLIDALPEDLHVVHGDFQMKNVMFSGDEPMLVDMDTLCVGQPIFDLAGLFVTYKLFKEDEPDNTMNFLGISGETSDLIWDDIMEYYFEDSVKKEVREEKIRILADVRFLNIIVISDLKNSELGKLRIEHTFSDMRRLIKKVNDLNL